MNNIKTFENFRNEKLDQKLNEGLFDALKNVWKFFKGVNKTLQTSIGNYTKKLENSKTWQDTLTNITNMVIQPNTKYFDDNMKNATTISEIRKINYEVHLSTFTELNATYKKWDGTNPKSPLSPSAIFVGTPFATMYNFTDTQKFTQNLTNAINGLVTTYAKKVGYPMEDVTKSINDFKDLTQEPPKENQTPAGSQNPPAGSQNPPVGSQTPPAGSQTPPAGSQNPPAGSQNPPAGSQNPPSNVNNSYIMSFNNFNKIFEVETPAGGNPNPTPPAADGNPDEQPIDKLKTENINNFKNNFYGIMQKKLKAFKPTSENTGSNVQKDVQDVIKTMTGSGQNVDSKKNLIKTITDPKLTADQLGKIRDAIAPILNITKPEETIGKF